MTLMPIPGAMTPRASAQRAQGEPRTTDTGSRFRDLLAGTNGGSREQANKGDPDSPANLAAPSAQMFNEHGFFARSDAPSPDDGSAVATAVAAPDSGAPVAERGAERPQPAAMADAGARPRAEGSQEPGDAREPPSRTTTIRVERDLPHSRPAPRVVAGTATPNEAAAPNEAEPEAMGVAREGVRRVRLPDASRAASVNVQVRLEPTGDALNLSARTDKLTREQRERLRAGIARLLAEHGFAAGEIRLNGEPAPPPRR